MKVSNFENHFHYGDTWSVQNGIRGLDKLASLKQDLELLERQVEARKRFEEQERKRLERLARLERSVFAWNNYIRSK